MCQSDFGHLQGAVQQPFEMLQAEPNEHGLPFLPFTPSLYSHCCLSPAAKSRRSLGLNQTGLASFNILEEWNNHLFSTILREPPAGYHFVSIQQILAADKFLLDKGFTGDKRPIADCCRC